MTPDQPAPTQPSEDIARLSRFIEGVIDWAGRGLTADSKQEALESLDRLTHLEGREEHPNPGGVAGLLQIEVDNENNDPWIRSVCRSAVMALRNLAPEVLSMASENARDHLIHLRECRQRRLSEEGWPKDVRQDIEALDVAIAQLTPSPATAEAGQEEAQGDNDIPDAVRAISYFVPEGYALMKRSEIDRIQNEAEALRIERDAARNPATGQEGALARADELLQAVDAGLIEGAHAERIRAAARDYFAARNPTTKDRPSTQGLAERDARLCPTCGGTEYEPLADRCNDPIHEDQDLSRDEDADR